MPKLTLYIDYSPKAYVNINALMNLPEYFNFYKHGVGPLVLRTMEKNSHFIVKFKNIIKKNTDNKKDIIFSRAYPSLQAYELMVTIIREYCVLDDYDVQVVFVLGRQDAVLENMHHFSIAMKNQDNKELKSSYKLIELCKKEFGDDKVHLLIDKDNYIDNRIYSTDGLEKFFPRIAKEPYTPNYVRTCYVSKQARQLASIFDGIDFLSFPFLSNEIIPLLHGMEQAGIWPPAYELSYEERKSILEECAQNNKMIAESYNNSQELFDTEIPKSLVSATSQVVTEKDHNLFVSKLKKETRDDLLLYLDADPKIVFEQDKMLIEALKRTDSIEVCRNYDEEYKITVVTLTCNHEKYLSDCIESVQSQKTNFKFKHIVLDNFSTDNTPQILHSFAKKHKSIFPVFRHPRNDKNTLWHLFSLANTEYVALCDGDDYFTDPLKLQKQVDLLEKNKNYSMCFHVTQVMYEDEPQRNYLYPTLERLPRVSDSYYITDIIRANLMQTSSVMYRWRFAKRLPEWFQATLSPGDWYWHLLHAEKGKIGFINEVMSVYRRHKSAFYSQNEYEGLTAHRLRHGMQELACFDAVNKHFERKYEKEIIPLAIGIFGNYIEHYRNTNDDSFINEAVKKYPEFAKIVLEKITSQSGIE